MSIYTGPPYPYSHDSTASLQATVLEELRSDNVSLRVRQQPRQALLAAIKKERNRKPVDPPVVVQMEVDRRADPTRLFLHNPNIFAVAALGTESGHLVGPPCLLGNTTSSLHRLKEVDSDGTWGNDGGFFVFGDISVAKMGRFRLHFTVFELRKDEGSVFMLQTTRSEIFEVVSPKDYLGLEESSFLTRAFADQGVRLRLRKEQRTMSGNRPRRDTKSTQEEEDRSFPSASPLHKRNSSWMTSPDDEDARSLKRSRTGLGSMYPGVQHSTRGWGAFPSADMQAWKTQAEDSSMGTASSLMSDMNRFSTAPYSQASFQGVPMGTDTIPTVTHTADWRNDSSPRRSHHSASSPARSQHHRNISSQMQHSPPRLEHSHTSPDALKQEDMSQDESQGQMGTSIYDEASFGYRTRGSFEEVVGMRVGTASSGRPFALQTLASASEHLAHIPQSSQIGASADAGMVGDMGALPLGLSPVATRHANPAVHNIHAYGHNTLVGNQSVAQQLLHRMGRESPWMPGREGNRSPYGTTHA